MSISPVKPGIISYMDATWISCLPIGHCKGPGIPAWIPRVGLVKAAPQLSVIPRELMEFPPLSFWDLLVSWPWERGALGRRLLRDGVG